MVPTEGPREKERERKGEKHRSTERPNKIITGYESRCREERKNNPVCGSFET
jgi:hypothetical protein